MAVRKSVAQAICGVNVPPCGIFSPADSGFSQSIFPVETIRDTGVGGCKDDTLSVEQEHALERLRQSGRYVDEVW